MDAALTIIEPFFRKICGDFGAELAEFDGESDHAHPLVNYPPRVSISKLVNSLKGATARRLRREMPTIAHRYWKGVLWTPSYFAGSCGDAPLSRIEQYIEAQQRPD